MLNDINIHHINDIYQGNRQFSREGSLKSNVTILWLYNFDNNYDKRHK